MMFLHWMSWEEAKRPGDAWIMQQEYTKPLFPVLEEVLEKPEALSPKFVALKQCSSNLKERNQWGVFLEQAEAVGSDHLQQTQQASSSFLSFLSV